MEKETIKVSLVGFGRKWEDFSALDYYLYYFEDDWFCEKVYPEVFDYSKVINIVDIDEDIEFAGIEEGTEIGREFEIEIDREILDNIKTAKDFYRSYITKINVFDLSDTCWVISSFELADGNVISCIRYKK